MLEIFFEKRRRQFAKSHGLQIYYLAQEVEAILAKTILRPPSPDVANNTGRTIPSMSPADLYTTVELPIITMSLPRQPSGRLQ